MSDSKIARGYLASYIEDPRFLFDEKNNFVDIVFFSHEISNLRQGNLTIDTVQDFGGDSVLNLEGGRAIVFDLPEH